MIDKDISFESPDVKDINIIDEHSIEYLVDFRSLGWVGKINITRYSNGYLYHDIGMGFKDFIKELEVLQWEYEVPSLIVQILVNRIPKNQSIDDLTILKNHMDKIDKFSRVMSMINGD